MIFSVLWGVRDLGVLWGRGRGAIFLGNTYVESESISRGGCVCVCTGRCCITMYDIKGV